MNLIKLIITLIILTLSLNARIIATVNHKMNIINIVDDKNNIDIIAPIASISISKTITRFESSFSIYVENYGRIYMDENTYNYLKVELMKE